MNIDAPEGLSAPQKSVDLRTMPSHGTGPWALVTGASDGIGQAFARALAAQGKHLVLVARNGDRLRTLAAELGSSHGVNCLVFDVDLGQPDAVTRLVRATVHLEVGTLIAAAGFGSSGPLLDSDIDTELGMLDVNCRAVLSLCWHLGRRMREQRRGAIVLMSSVLAFQGTPGSVNYAATKAYIQSLAEGLRVELGPHGVQVVASAPGPVATGFAARAGLQMGRTASADGVARETLAALGRRTTVRPGWLSRALGWSLAMLPRPMRVRVIGEVMKGMTAHQAHRLKPPAREPDMLG